MNAAPPTITIGKLIEKVVSWNPPRDAPEDKLHYIDLSSVDNTTKQITANQTVIGREAPSRARQRVKAGDILVSTVRPNLNGVARVPGHLDGATASTGFCVLRPQPSKLNANYLFHWVQSVEFVADMMRKATGASYPAVSDKIIAQSEIPLPSLDEQKRIAAILDQADELRRKRQRSIDRLDNFGEAAFDQINVSNGNWSQLSEVCKFENGDRGKNYPGKKSLLKHGVPFVSAADLDANGDVVRENLSYISDDRFRILRSGKFSGGDFLFCLRGSLGKFALVPDGMSGAIASSLVIIRISNSIDHEFFRGYLGSRLVKKEINFYSNGLAQPNLSGASLKKFKIFLPPIEVQRKFGETMTKIVEARERLLRSKAQMDQLFASLQHRAFRGEV